MTNETKGGAFHGVVGATGKVGAHVSSGQPGVAPAGARSKGGLPSAADLDVAEAEKKIQAATTASFELTVQEQIVVALVRAGYDEEEATEMAQASIAQIEARK
jgi:hypothetical protein